MLDQLAIAKGGGGLLWNKGEKEEKKERSQVEGRP